MMVRWFLLEAAFLGMTAAGVPAQERSRLTLNEAVRLALARAPALEASRAAVAAAAGAVQEAEARRWPRAALEASATTFSDPMLVAPLHAFDPTRVPRFEQTLVQGRLGLGYTLFDGGGRGGRIGQTRAIEAERASRTRATEQLVIGSVVRSYAEVQSARQMLTAEERRLAALRAEAERVRRFLEEGRAARVEDLRVQAALARAEADSSEAAVRLDLVETALARITGLEVGVTRTALLETVVATADPLPDRDAVWRAAQAANPSLEIAALRIAAADAVLRAERAELWPVLRLEGRGVTYGATEGDFSTEWQAGFRMSYTVFTGGSRRGAITRARHALRGAEAERREALDELDAEIDVAFARAVDAGRQVAALERAATSQAEVVRTEALALSEGAGVQSDYLRAEADQAAVLAELSAARVTALVARVELARLAGALSLETLLTLVEAR